MYYKTIHLFDVIELQDIDYDNIIKMVKKSNIYLGYIQHEPRKNDSYQRYLEQKKQVYYSHLEEKKQVYYSHLEEKKTDSQHISGNSQIYNYEPLSYEKLTTLKERNPLDNDYEISPNLIVTLSEEGINPLYQPIVLREEKQEESSLLLVDDHLEFMNNRYFDKQFTYSQSQRFALIPVRATFNGEYVDSQVILTVYKEGLVTIHLIFSLPAADALTLEGDTPNVILFDEVTFHHIKDKYKADDYWHTYTDSSDNNNDNNVLDVYKVLKYYKNLLRKVTNTTTKNNSISTAQMFFSISEIAKDKSQVQEDEKDLSIQKNLNTFTGILKNGNAEIMNRLTKKAKNEYLDSISVRDDIDISFWVSKSTALVFHKSTPTVKKMHDDLKMNYYQESEIDTSTIDLNNIESNPYFQEEYYHMTTVMALEFAKLYELALIHKFNARQILNLLRYENYESPVDLEKVRSKMNHFLLNYNAELVFNSDGSPKEDYKHILEKLGVNNLVEFAQSSIDNIHIDFSNLIERQNEFQNEKMQEQKKIIERQEKIQDERLQEQKDNMQIQEKENENNIIFLTSTLAVILGYDPLHSLIEGILSIIYSDFIRHSVSISIGVWILLVIIVVVINVKKRKGLKKQKNLSS